MRLDVLLEAAKPMLDLQTRLLDLDIADGWDIELTKKGLMAVKGKHTLTYDGRKAECVAYRYKQKCVENAFDVLEAMIGLCELAGAVDRLISGMVLDENSSLPMLEAERNEKGFCVLYYGEWDLAFTDFSGHTVVTSLSQAAAWIRDNTL